MHWLKKYNNLNNHSIKVYTSHHIPAKMLFNTEKSETLCNDLVAQNKNTKDTGG